MSSLKYILLAYDVRCALSIYLFKIEVLDSKAWRRPGRLTPEYYRILLLTLFYIYNSLTPISSFKLKTDVFETLNKLFKI